MIKVKQFVKTGLLIIGLIIVSACAQNSTKFSDTDVASFKELCKNDGNKFMTMEPLKDGFPTGESKCPGCMIGASHFCVMDEYKKAKVK